MHRKWVSDEATEDHPYFYELSHFEVPEKQLAKGAIKTPPAVELTPFEIIFDVEGLEKLRDTLNTCEEFAVDLEVWSSFYEVQANDTRSYLGFVCLMQISTRNRDYLIDPFPIWKHMHILNEPFANPNILKVLGEFRR